MNSIVWWKDTRLLAAGDALGLRNRPVGISHVPDPTTQELIDAFTACHWTVQALIVGTAYLMSPDGDRAMIQVSEDDPQRIIRVELNSEVIPVADSARRVRECWRWG